MNDTLVEAIARGIAKAKGIEICADASYRHSTFGPLAQAALTAITEAGYVICPREPTPAMMEMGRRDGDVLCADEVWEAMISAAQGDGA